MSAKTASRGGQRGRPRKKIRLSGSKKQDWGEDKDEENMDISINDASTSQTANKKVVKIQGSSDSNKQEGREVKNNDNMDISIENAPTSQTVEKKEVKRRGRPRKCDSLKQVPKPHGKSSDSESHVNKCTASVSSDPLIKESSKEIEDSPMDVSSDSGMSLRRSRMTRRSGSSISDRENEAVSKKTSVYTKPEDMKTTSDLSINKGEERDKSQLITPPVKKDPKIKKTMPMKHTNQMQQIESVIDSDLGEGIVNHQQSEVENSNKGLKENEIIETEKKDKKNKNKDFSPVHKRPITRHSSRNSKGSESISSENERSLNSQEITLSSTVGSQASQKKIRKRAKRAESLSSEQDTDIEPTQNISASKDFNEKAISPKAIGKGTDPQVPVNVRKRGRKSLKSPHYSVPSAQVKDVESPVLDIKLLRESLNNVLNEPKSKRSKLNQPCLPKPKRKDSSSNRESGKAETDLNLQVERDTEFKDEIPSNDSLNTITRTNSEEENLKSPLLTKKDDLNFCHEKSTEEDREKTEMIAVRGRRGRRKLHQTRGKKLGRKRKISNQVHSLNYSEDNVAIMEDLEHSDSAPLFKARTSRRSTKSNQHNEHDEQYEKKELSENSFSVEGSDTQKDDSMLCTKPSSKGNLPLEKVKTSGDSDMKPCLIEDNISEDKESEKTLIDKLALKSTQENSKSEDGKMDHTELNVDCNDQYKSSVKRNSFRGRKKKAGVSKGKYKKLTSENVRRKAEISMENEEKSTEIVKSNFLLGDISVVVEKLNLNDPQILKLMSPKTVSKSLENEASDMQLSQDIHANNEIENETKSVNTEEEPSKTDDITQGSVSSIHSEMALSFHPRDPETENTADCFASSSQSIIDDNFDLKKLPHKNETVAANSLLTSEKDNASEFSIHNSNDINNMTLVKSEIASEKEASNTSKILITRDIKEKQNELEDLKSNSSSLNTSSRSIITCDDSQSQVEKSTNSIEKMTVCESDLNLTISENDEKSSDLLGCTAGSSGANSYTEMEVDQNSESTEMNQADLETESDWFNLNLKSLSMSKKNIESQSGDISIPMEESESSDDSQQSETILISVQQDEMKRIIVNMSSASVSSSSADCKNDGGKTDSDNPISFKNSSISTPQSKPTDSNLESFESINVDMEAVLKDQVELESGKELGVDGALEEVGEVIDNGLEDEIVKALEDERDANPELEEVREVFNAALKEMTEITDTELDVTLVDDRNIDSFSIEEGQVTDTLVQGKNNIFEDKSNKQFEVTRDRAIESNEDIISDIKDQSNFDQDIVESENETALEEQANRDAIKLQTEAAKNESEISFKAKEVENVFEGENEATLEEQANSDADLQQQLAKSDVTREMREDETEVASYPALEDEKKSRNNSDIEDKIKYDTALEDQPSVETDLSLEDRQQVESSITPETLIEVKNTNTIEEPQQVEIISTFKDQEKNNLVSENLSESGKVLETDSTVQKDTSFSSFSYTQIFKDVDFFYDEDSERNNNNVDSLKLDNAEVLESPKVPIEENENNKSFEMDQDGPGCSYTEVKTVEEPKSDEAEEEIVWPRMLNASTRIYLTHLSDVIIEGLRHLTNLRPTDPIQFLANWMLENKTRAYVRMAEQRPQ